MRESVSKCFAGIFRWPGKARSGHRSDDFDCDSAEEDYNWIGEEEIVGPSLYGDEEQRYASTEDPNGFTVMAAAAVIPPPRGAEEETDYGVQEYQHSGSCAESQAILPPSPESPCYLVSGEQGQSSDHDEESQDPENQTACCMLSRCWLVVTAILYALVFVLFFPMVKLSVGAGQGAWPFDDNITCGNSSPSNLHYLYIRRIMAIVAFIPMTGGVFVQFGLTVALIRGKTSWRRPVEISSYVFSLAYLVYVAVLPYECGFSSGVAVVAIMCAYLALIVFLVAPCIQKAALRGTATPLQQSGREEEEGVNENSPLMRGVSVRRQAYYQLTY